MPYVHEYSCTWNTVKPYYRQLGADGVPRVMVMDQAPSETAGGTLLQPCSCWEERQRGYLHGPAPQHSHQCQHCERWYPCTESCEGHRDERYYCKPCAEVV